MNFSDDIGLQLHYLKLMGDSYFELGDEHKQKIVHCRPVFTVIPGNLN